MPRLFPYSQDVGNFIPDPAVRGGVCLAMSYYVMKRMLAGVMTTPELLARKMGLFTSMQRAREGEVRQQFAGNGWTGMLTKRDNLLVNSLQVYSDSQDLFREFLECVEDLRSDKSYDKMALLYLVYGNDWAHAMAVCVGVRRPWMQMFDPNAGMFEATTAPEMDKIALAMRNAYPDGQKYTGLAVIGTPRDLKALAAD